jgi:hypothetical protein
MEQIQKRIGPFLIQTILGAEGAVATYQAIDTRTNQPLLLYTFDTHLQPEPEAAQRFLQQAQSLVRFRHAHLVTVRETAQIDGLCYVATEPVSGTTLDSYLQQQQDALTPEQTTAVVQQLADSLDFAHRNGLVHGQLTPNAIWLTPEGQIKVSGLGIGTTAELSGNEAEHPLPITPYTAPEQITGEYPISPRTDIYSLGAIAYTMLTGQAPFDAESPTLATQITQAPPPAPEALNPQIPISMAAVLRFVLAKEPNSRYAQASEFANALRQAQSWGEPKSLALVPVVSKAPAPAARASASWPRTWILGLAILLLASLTGVLIARRILFADQATEVAQATPTIVTPIALAQGAGDAPPTPTATLPAPDEGEPAVVASNEQTALSSDTVTASNTVTETVAMTTAEEPVLLPTATDTPLPPAEDPVIAAATVPTDTNTAVPTNTDTPAPTATDTAVPTDTNTPVPTDTAVPTDTPPPTNTDTPVPTATNSPAPTNTPIPPTDTNTPVPPTNTPVPPTSTDTPLPPTATVQIILVPTATDTPAPNGDSYARAAHGHQYGAADQHASAHEYAGAATDGYRNSDDSAYSDQYGCAIAQGNQAVAASHKHAHADAPANGNGNDRASYADQYGAANQHAAAHEYAGAATDRDANRGTAGAPECDGDC